MDERYSNALAILQDALDRCLTEDMRRPEVFAALDFLSQQATVKWPFDQFRDALSRDGSQQWESEARWQMLNASFERDQADFEQSWMRRKSTDFLFVVDWITEESFKCGLTAISGPFLITSVMAHMRLRDHPL